MDGALESYGKFRAYLGVVLAALICSSMSASGYYAITAKPKEYKSTEGTLSNVNCDSYTCTANVSVNISGVNYTFGMYGENLVENSKIKVYYSNDTPPGFNPYTEPSDTTPPKGIGYGLIGIGLCILVVAMVVAYFVSTSPTAAKIYGGVGAISNISQLVR